jgi:alkylhydroperoxidase/carboxymuconolactone decarboxylase family protein YurZ
VTRGDRAAVRFGDNRPAQEVRMGKIPGWYKEQGRRQPAVIKAYEDLGAACRKAGPLDAKTQALAKLAIAIGGRLEGAVHSHARRALEAGATLEEVRHVVLLSTTTIGFPAMMAALSWVEDVSKEEKALTS